MYERQTNRLLGYPDDARLLILNADDFGMYRAITEGILQSIREGVVCSTSLMTPCPGAAQAISLLAQNPDIPFGVHLSIIRDLRDYWWKPLTPAEEIPSLVDETGNFYHVDRMDDLLAQAQTDDLEREFRAQIETVLDAGLKPTHLDWHCLPNGGRADIFDLSFRLAREYGLAMRAYDPPFTDQLHDQKLPSDDYPVLDSFTLEIEGKSAQYAQLLRDLPAGLNEWAVHPSVGDAESQAIDDGWRVRRTDFEFLISPEAREVIRQEGIILLSYKPLQDVWQGKSAPI